MNRLYFALIFLLFGLFYSSFGYFIEEGVLDLSEFSFNERHTVALQGDAEFYWKKQLFFSDFQSDSSPLPDAYISLPSSWNRIEIDGKKIGGAGFATVRLRVHLPERARISLALKLPTIHTAYRFYVDSTLVSKVGEFGVEPDVTVSDYEPKVVYLGSLTDSFELIFHISNYINNKGGPWQRIYIGSIEAVKRKHDLFMAYDLFLIGILLFFVVHHAISYYLFQDATRSLASKYFALISFTMAIRILVTGDKMAYFLFPDVPLSLFLYLDYFSLFFSLALYHKYINISYSRWSSTKLKNGVIYTIYVFVAITTLTPINVYSNIIIPFQIFAVSVLFYHFYIGMQAIKEYKVKGGVLLVNTFVIISCSVHDILSDHSMATSLPLIPLGNVFVAITLSYIASRTHVQLYQQNVIYNNRLSGVNETLTKFVPSQFFQTLGKEPTDLSLGDQKSGTMAILFCDIRNFTTISEHLTPERNFQFINEYIALIAPFIDENGGYIDKFIGDAVMALFPYNPDGALKASLAITEAVATADLLPTYKESVPLSVGIGIHYGPMTLGIIGTEERWEDTVIGNSVNIAARLEQLTKTYDVSILASEDLLHQVEVQDFQRERLDEVAVKGKLEQVTIYSIWK